MSENQVDTAALRKRLETKLSEIQEQLRAIEIVEKLSRQRIAAAPPTPTSGTSEKSMSLTVLDLVTDDWQPADDLVTAVQTALPEVGRQPIFTALRRWEERGKIEMRGSRGEGFRFRRKREKDPERATP